MNPLAASALRSTLRRLELATCLLEDAAEGGHPILVGQAYAEVLLARGELAAAMQLDELEETLAKADTERPQRSAPVLRIVR